MKTWILKNDISRSPQAAFKMYACDRKKNRFNSDVSLANRPKHYFLARKLKSQIKNLSKLLNEELIAETEND